MINEKKLILSRKHLPFILDSNDSLNVFNLIRLLKEQSREAVIFLDVSNLEEDIQALIASKLHHLLNIYNYIHDKDAYLQLNYSNIDEVLLRKITGSSSVFEENGYFIFTEEQATNNRLSIDNSHIVKNIRGAALLALTHDLLSEGHIKGNQFSIFDHTSKVKLHSASTFLNNKENAEVMWKMLLGFEEINDKDDFKDLNNKIRICNKHKKELEGIINITINEINKSSLSSSIADSVREHFGLPDCLFTKLTELEIWLVDDQQANGWFELFSNLFSSLKVKIKPFSDIESVKCQIKFHDDIGFREPDLAFIDLRLSSKDNKDESYNTFDLSGFKALELLMSKWTSTSVMIISASNKLWNMEKAIEKGAVAYWRKSDEALSFTNHKAILTAFDIHFNLFDKLKTSVNRCRFQNIFRIMKVISSELEFNRTNFKNLVEAIHRFEIELSQKTNWMCWTKSSEERVKDSLLLGTMEIFNELENELLNRSNASLVLDSSKKIQISNKEDNRIINSSLEYLDNKYEIKGISLESHFDICKGVRNKLPSIHGSNAENDVKHAAIKDIEMSLLIIYCLIKELKLNIK